MGQKIARAVSGIKMCVILQARCLGKVAYGGWRWRLISTHYHRHGMELSSQFHVPGETFQNLRDRRLHANRNGIERGAE
jgi:hypothetical protein